MESPLLQAFWDDQKNIFLEFKTYNEEIEPEEIKSIHVKFEIIPVDNKELYQKELPYLISIDKFYFLDDSIYFPINFDDLNHSDDLKIKFLLLSIIFYSGKRLLYSLEEIFEMDDILLIEDNFDNFIQEIKRSKIKIESSIVQERVIETIDKDPETNKEKRTYVYEKNRFHNVRTIETDTITTLINDGNERLRNVEEELKNIKAMIKSLSFNNVSNVSLGFQKGPPRKLGIERIKRPNGLKLNNLLPSPKSLEYLPELIALMDDNEKFRSYLKPISNEDLEKITLNDEQLIEKQEALYKRQIEMLKNKEEKIANLDNLKKPK